MDNDKRQQAINDARTMLAWLELHPNIPLPDVLSGGAPFYVYTLHTKEDAAMAAREFGECEKEPEDTLFFLTKRFGLHVLSVVFQRDQVCERVVVATEEIPETVIPERIEPARVVETVEWRCGSILAAVPSATVEEVDAILV